jgi:hypothetical protein
MQRFALLLAVLAACATSKPAEIGPAAGPASSPPLGSAAGPASGAPLAAVGDTLKATLTAANEVPPPTVDPRQAPSGSATFTVSGSTISYKVSVMNLSSPYTAAHIHTGASGVAGPVLVPLNLSPGGQGEASGEGTIDASQIKGKKADGSAMSMDELVAAMRGGSTYINVHTQNNKSGEARGQIQP